MTFLNADEFASGSTSDPVLVAALFVLTLMVVLLFSQRG